jgi:hypothetical protein
MFIPNIILLNPGSASISSILSSMYIKKCTAALKPTAHSYQAFIRFVSHTVFFAFKVFPDSASTAANAAHSVQPTPS